MQFLEQSIASASWPLGSIAACALDSAREKKLPANTFEAPHPFATLQEHIAMQIGCIPRLIFVYFVYAGYGDWRTYAKTLSSSWILPLIARDVGLCLFVGLVDSFLFLSDFSPFKKSMERHKFVMAGSPPRYPLVAKESNGTSGLLREAFWCCCTAALAGAMEAGVLHAFATGRFTALYSGDAWWTDARTVFFMVTWFYTQNVQFYTMHRLLHKWGTTTIPDIGQFLYDHVHSLHHKSRSPTAFSGISMHPVEGALYLSYALFPLLFGCHFMAFLYIKTNLIVAAMLGHSAFENPGTGSIPHYLHHSKVAVNCASFWVQLCCCFNWLLPSLQRPSYHPPPPPTTRTPSRCGEPLALGLVFWHLGSNRGGGRCKHKASHEQGRLKNRKVSWRGDI
jgi:sterol desaturase/sphingolipid hydroxylase (fatty acid hydroxylase superfamily)